MTVELVGFKVGRGKRKGVGNSRYMWRAGWGRIEEGADVVVMGREGAGMVEGRRGCL